MNLLLDSNTVVWFLEGAPALSDKAANLIESLESRSMVSSVTPWELAVKTGLGKIRLPYRLDEEFDSALESMGFELIPLSRSALERTARLPGHHRDPFDRLLVAEAIEHGATLISPNEVFDHYGVKRVW
ncbi:MAG: PIN domain nuclease [Verrucomicrobiaceae bacterium]|nr:PIN domain nuclease [Verrucomicrobiaceae bacterium]